MSNAITDILDEVIFEQDEDNSTIQEYGKALQALYEAVKGCVPEEIDFRGNSSEWNDCRAKILTNLSLLFGVPLGNPEKPEATNSQPQLADNQSEGANHE